MRAANGTGRQDGFAPGAGNHGHATTDEFHALAQAAVHAQARHLAFGQYRQVGAVFGRLEKGFHGIPAYAATLIDFELRDAFIVAAVEVIHCGNARLDRSITEGVEYVPAQPLLFHPPFMAAIAIGIGIGCAMQCAGTAPVVFRMFEQGQHVLP